GPWLPEPLIVGPDATEWVERAESLSFGLLVVLETLSPLERAVFVLREGFELPYAEIAEILGRGVEAVRQLAVRARAHVQARRPRFPSDPAAQRRLTERFLAASAGGSLEALLDLLAPEATLVADGGGKARARWPASWCPPPARRQSPGSCARSGDGRRRTRGWRWPVSTARRGSSSPPMARSSRCSCWRSRTNASSASSSWPTPTSSPR